MAAVAPPPRTSPPCGPKSSSSSPPAPTAANFDTPAAVQTVDTKDGDGSGSLPGRPHSHSVTDESGSHPGSHLSHPDLEETHRVLTQAGDGQGEGRQRSMSDASHFSDIAQLAARAMESVDMDRLCSELFTQEMMTHEELEEAVAHAAVTAAQQVQGPGAQGQGTHPQGRQVTDCDSSASTQGSAVPSTIAIAVPSKNADALQVQQQQQANLKANHQAGLVQAAQAQAQAAHALHLHGFSTGLTQLMSSQQYGAFAHAAPAPAQFSHPRGGGGDAKRQRLDDSLNAVAYQPMQVQNYGQPTQAANVQATIQAAAAVAPKPQAKEGEVACSRCRFPGADVRIHCASGCAYHARCMDLVALCQDTNNVAPTAGKHRKVCVKSCPHCRTPSNGMEILPLSFAEMDRVQESARAAFLHSGLVDPKVGGTKRGHDGLDMHPSLLGLPTAIPSHSGAQPPRRSVQCYDPARPRTGRWTDEEILFRDTLISHFLAGNLPLSNGLKLNDFLPAMLKSKQSRLAKKMKHAKLSTKYFFPKAGCLGAQDAAVALSKLEQEFVSSIPDPVERSEITFHMGREWRDHFANRCHSLGVRFDGAAWLGSVEDMDRRLAYETERHRLAKRRFLMGKAMEKDCDPKGQAHEAGVFVNNGASGGWGGNRDEFELVVEKSVSNSAGTAHGGAPPAPVINAGAKEQGHQGIWSSSEPNFKHAAPFLAGIASYVERNGVPFEHVDVWVPSHRDDNSDKRFRLSFGGSVTMGVQVVSATAPPPGDGASSPPPSEAATSATTTMRRQPLSQEDKTSLALFGDYSEKFSFDPGCGLPGRTFESGLPSWERNVSETRQFERRGGAAQFGVKTAVSLPVESPNVGRVVLVFYSKYDRVKDEGLVARMATDLKLLNPSPRWKLVVDVDSVSHAADGTSSLQAPPPSGGDFGARTSPMQAVTAPTRQTSVGSTISSNAPQQADAASAKEKQIKDLILLLGENIPSDMNSPLGQQLQGIMSLRLILLRGNARTPEEEQLIDTVLVLFASYLRAGRKRSEIAVMVARDFAFHLQMERSLAAKYSCAPACAPAPTPGPALPQAPPPSMYAVAAANAMMSNYGGVPAPAGHYNPMMAFSGAQQPFMRQDSNHSAASYTASPRSTASR